MSFRARLTVTAAVAVAVAVVLASALVYVLVRAELRSEVDDGLRSRAAKVMRNPFPVHEAFEGGFELRIPPQSLGGPSGYTQLVDSTGQTALPFGETVKLPVSERTKAVAAGTQPGYLVDAEVQNTHMRVLTLPLRPDLALQIARPLDEVDRTLRRIRAFLLIIGLGGIGTATALGLGVAQTALTPVRRLTAATEYVAATQDLRSRIEAGGRDELSRLGASFNTMLEALEGSVEAQRRLVADASHELRTPLTSLRTNLEVLARDERLDPDERERLVRAAVDQLDQMTALVSELLQLARGEVAGIEHEDVRLDLLVSEAVGRARRNSPGAAFSTDLEETVVHGDRGAIERAVGNLLDNAAKWSPPGGAVEVSVHDGEVVVRDHGPGIDERDLPYVFDRFYRAPAARRLPGSGLGLSIVRQVAEAHGGDVRAERAEDGGTRMHLRLLPTS